MMIPPYLQKGDTIGIVCPAGYLPAEKAQTCIDVLQQWGYRVKTGKTLGHQFHYFAGTDEERLLDLQQMLDDDSVQAILCGRGGYGVSRIIDRLNFDRFRRKPKWIIGFSDITVLHAHLFTVLQTASIHAPMAAAFNDDGWQNVYVQSLKQALEGHTASYTCDAHAFNQPGTVTAPLVGGNLSLLAHMVGSASDVDTRGKILFLEDVGEYIYNVDRMLLQLKRSGKLEGLAGLVVGGFTDMKDTVIPFGQTVEEVIRDQVKAYNYPICFNFPVSHSAANYALKVGVTYCLEVNPGGVKLREQG
jgi:muramoyltetrapeptide carboxypeptidase